MEWLHQRANEGHYLPRSVGLTGARARLLVQAHAEAQEHLRRSAAHRYAAYQLAPDSYAWIRLHQGLMPAGLSGRLILRKTRYFTCHPTEPRFAIREQAYAR